MTVATMKKRAETTRLQAVKRVVILAASMPGGTSYYGAQLANALSRHFKVMIIISEEMRQFPFAPNLEVATIRKSKILGMPNPVVYRQIFRCIKNFQPDLVHDPLGNAFRWTFGLWPVLARHWPLIITEHDPKPHLGMGGLFSFIGRTVARKSAHFFFVHGKRCRQALIETGIEPDKVSTIRHGSYAIYNHKRYLEIAEEANTVLFFGQLRPNKGIYRLMAIARQVREQFPAARFIVAGQQVKLPSRRTMAKVHRTIEALKAEPGFEVHDRFIENDEIELFFRRCALVVLPYEEATQSGVIPIAYAFGKPAVAYDLGDIRENIIDDETSLLVQPGNEEALVNAVVALLRDSARRHNMGRRAEAWAQRELSWDAIAERAAQLYALVLSKVGRLAS